MKWLPWIGWLALPLALCRAVEPPAPALRLSFADLAKAEHGTEFESGYTYPPALSAAEGREVEIQGYMAPYDSLENMGCFMLMPSPGGCYFCEPPSPGQVVIVHQGKAAARAFVPSPLRVRGTLHLSTRASTLPDHQAGFLYVLDDATVSKMPWPQGNPQARPAAAPHKPGSGH